MAAASVDWELRGGGAAKTADWPVAAEAGEVVWWDPVLPEKERGGSCFIDYL